MIAFENHPLPASRNIQKASASKFAQKGYLLPITHSSKKYCITNALYGTEDDIV
jgi:hypothetical protein